MAVLAIGMVLIVTRGGSGLPTGDEPTYFYDVETGELFIASGNQVPPIQSPAGNEAVRANVYTCGACTEEERFVGYYEKYTPEAKKTLEQAQAEQDDGGNDPDEGMAQGMGMMQAQMSGLMVSLDGEEWQSRQQMDLQSEGLMEQVRSQCDDPSQLKFCGPG